MTAAGETPGRGPSAIATVATIAYAGFLVGPPLIGSLAHSVGLDHALWVVVLLGRRHVRPGRHRPRPARGARLGACPRTSTVRCSSCAPCCSTPTCWCAPWLPAAAGRPPRRGGGSSCARSTSRTAGTCRSSPTTSARRPPPTRVRRPGRRRGRRPARPAVRQLARADDHRDAAAAGDQEGPGPAAPEGRGRRAAAPSTTGRRGTSSTRATRCSGCSARARASGARSTRSCGCCRPRWPRPTCRPGGRCGSSTSAAATPT